MMITQREVSQAMAQVNVAFEVANDKIDKLEAEVKALTKEKANGNAKKGQSKS
jgi:GTP-binding protein EngB required for normal cell division